MSHDESNLVLIKKLHELAKNYVATEENVDKLKVRLAEADQRHETVDRSTKHQEFLDYNYSI